MGGGKNFLGFEEGFGVPSFILSILNRHKSGEISLCHPPSTTIEANGGNGGGGGGGTRPWWGGGGVPGSTEAQKFFGRHSRLFLIVYHWCVGRGG